MSEGDNVSYWAERWEARAIGFHMNQLNPCIQENLEKWLGPAPVLDNADAKFNVAPKNSKRVLFPLCGKTVDMAVLSKMGYYVGGLEGVSTAVKEFAEDNSIILTQEHPDNVPSILQGKFDVYEGTRVRIFVGDYFKWPTTEKHSIEELKNAGVAELYDAAFDRGSMVAIDPKLRKEYVRVMDALLAPGAKVLISAITYDQSEMAGPPHSLSIEEITELYQGLPDGKDRYSIEVLGNPDWESSAPVGVNKFLRSHGGPLSKVINISVIVTKKY